MTRRREIDIRINLLKSMKKVILINELFVFFFTCQSSPIRRIVKEKKIMAEECFFSGMIYGSPFTSDG